jgi:hypothetical protein
MPFPTMRERTDAAVCAPVVLPRSAAIAGIGRIISLNVQVTH